MKKFLKIVTVSSLLLVMSSFAVHKFYVSIYQINFAQDKKMLQITSRIFVDDLNNMLKIKYNQKTNLGEPNESANDITLMKKYIFENFSVKVNGQSKAINFANKEMEGNVLICYYNVKDIPKIKTLEIHNSVLHDFVDEQQNIIQTTVYGKKQSFLFTPGNAKGLLKP
ncbi:hypothetical protein NAT51_04425 [Flavobacterium amniphilum]|uniref:DUF6702 family protein n=1 Tax=Flavobacterium amniphilum TaxID=1834035 RepID=UPI00202A9B19|nr:DUF6702 family protein [Flavobacterium amniphilum]MCL9804754.1 hypothetical protein [Flavobacterium amniphilum]